MIPRKTNLITPGAIESTAFTNLLVGIFLNSPHITSHDLRGLRESDIYNYYGSPFLDSLRHYAENSTLQQVNILHMLQRYFVSFIQFSPLRSF